jgi:uracil-DNA glycosylase
VSALEEGRFRRIFRRAHAGHAGCAADEWLAEPCRDAVGRPVSRPLVWSRRNGPWRRVEVLWVGAAPGNAGGLGSGERGAHGTRIPFGGDIAGGNLEVLLSSIGLDRNGTFIVASLNQLPDRGGGEPTSRELARAVGDYPHSVALLRDTVVAAGPSLVIALGNVALRTLAAALTTPGATTGAPLRLPGSGRLVAAGLERGFAMRWPRHALPFAGDFVDDWRVSWEGEPAFHVLQLLHPSAQNMSPFAGVHTQFHQRMLQTLAALGAAARDVLGREPVRNRPRPPDHGIYALPEWRERVAVAHRRYDELWRARGV